ncbi:reverse transcriptase domain-containing protein [Tanacetum coccineum]
MRTRSQSREQRPPPPEGPPVVIEPLRIEYPFQEDPTVEPMADTRTMAQLLQAPTEGYEDAILIPEIVANNFELKHGLINLVQNKQFFGHDKEDPHAHIRYFNKITSTMRVPNVPIATIKLMLFPFSIEGAARIWLEKEPPRSIQTWDDLVSKFINQFFPPSKTTNLRNEITRFQQRFDESFYEAWDRFNDLLRACPHHGFSELHQLDTFYNALNINDQDSLNSAAGGNFLDKMPRECLKIIESKSKVRQTRAKAVVAKVSTNSSTQAVSSDVAELKDIVRALLLDKKNQASAPAPAPAPVKAVELSCVTCGGAHSHQNCPATHGNVYRDNISEYVSQAAAANYNQVSSNFRPQMVANHIRPPGFPPVQNSQANNANNFNRGNNFNQNRESNFNQNRGGNFNQSNFSQNQLHRPQVNQSPAYQAPVPQTHSVTKNDFDNYVKANDAIMRNMQNNLQNQGQSMQIETNKLNNQMANLTDMLAKFVTANTASTSGSGTLPGNTVTNPREDLKGITTRSGVAYQGPPIPTSSVVKPIPEVTKDQVHPSCSQSTAPVQPPVGPEPITTPVFEPIVAPVVAPVPNTKPSVSLPYPSRRDNEKSRNQANEQIDKFYEIFKEMSFEISFTDALVLMPKFASTLRTLLGNKEKLTEVARTSNEPCLARTSMNEHCSAVILNKLPRKLGDPGKFLIPCEFPGMDECLALADLGASINLMPFSVWEKLSLPDLTPTCMTLELADRSISKPMGIAKDISVKVGVFHFPADFVVVDFEPDPRVPLILGSDFPVLDEADSFLGLADDPDLNTLPPPKSRTYLPEVEAEFKFVKTNTANSSIDEPTEVELKELPPHLEYAFLEGDNKLPVIIAKKLDVEEKSALVKGAKVPTSGLSLKLSDIQGINPEFCYTQRFLWKKTMHQRSIPSKMDSPWVSPIHCVPKKGGMTVCMPFGLCNATGSFLSCMLVIFHDMVEEDDGSLYGRFSSLGNSFQTALRLDHMHSKCEDTNLSLNWGEEPFYWVKEGLSSAIRFLMKLGIVVDKSKSDVIAKCTSSNTTSKDLGVFSGHAGAENLQRSSMSDWKNPYENVPMIPKWIMNVFLLRLVIYGDLCGDSRTHVSADFCKYYHAGGFMRLCATAMKLLRFSQLAQWTTGGIMEQPHSQKRSFRLPVSSGHSSIKMPHEFVKNCDSLANVKEKLLKRDEMASKLHPRKWISSKKTENQPNDKTEHGMEKTVQNQGPEVQKLQSQSLIRRISSQTVRN